MPDRPTKLRDGLGGFKRILGNDPVPLACFLGPFNSRFSLMTRCSMARACDPRMLIGMSNVARACRRLAIASLSIALGVVLPAKISAYDAARWRAGDVTLQSSLANGSLSWVESRKLSASSFATSDDLFDGEWLFGTYFMTGMGLGQVALEHPELQHEYARQMDVCIESLLSHPVRAFDTKMWNHDPLRAIDDVHVQHAAYLGYLNLLLSLHRLVDPTSRHAALNDRLSAVLQRSLETSPTGLLETYPGQVFPVDNMSIGGSIGLRALAIGEARPRWLDRWTSMIRDRYVDRSTGLLVQRVHPVTGAAVDAPRGSGTAFGAYMLSFGERELTHDLDLAVRRELDTSLAGFGAIREYPRGYAGSGDIDSGPVVLGVGVSPTGFSIAAARRLDDPAWHARLVATATLFGAPVASAGRLQFVSGGPIGDAIMFAMLTAPAHPISRSAKGVNAPQGG